MRKAKYNFEKTLIDGVASNPKRLWKYVQSKTTDGIITSDDSEIVEILNNFFSSVFTDENSSDWHTITGN